MLSHSLNSIHPVIPKKSSMQPGHLCTCPVVSRHSGIQALYTGSESRMFPLPLGAVFLLCLTTWGSRQFLVLSYSFLPWGPWTHQYALSLEKRLCPGSSWSRCCWLLSSSAVTPSQVTPWFVTPFTEMGTVCLSSACLYTGFLHVNSVRKRTLSLWSRLSPQRLAKCLVLNVHGIVEWNNRQSLC